MLRPCFLSTIYRLTSADTDLALRLLAGRFAAAEPLGITNETARNQAQIHLPQDWNAPAGRAGCSFGARCCANANQRYTVFAARTEGIEENLTLPPNGGFQDRGDWARLSTAAKRDVPNPGHFNAQRTCRRRTRHFHPERNCCRMRRLHAGARPSLSRGASHESTHHEPTHRAHSDEHVLSGADELCDWVW